MQNSQNFKSILLKIASPEEILSWSYGEVVKPETINYRTQKFEKDGLFAENIFGPSRDFECYCGKYKRIRYKNIICDKCGVEVTNSSVRRERMGHIKLAVPVVHIWFLRVVPSKIGLLLDKSVNDLEKIIYFAAYIVTEIDEKARAKVFKETKDKETREELKNLQKMQVLSELTYRDYSLKFGYVFKAQMGAEGIREALKELDLNQVAKELNSKKIKDEKTLRRLRVIQSMIRNNLRPEWMCLTALPVISPDLRPMVQLDGGRFATSDLNDLYRRIINRNNRLKRLIELGAPEVICRNEKRMLQEAVDALIDNSLRHSQTQVSASTGGRRPLRSLADMLKGKQGRFRQNLLGKRVDYSGRSVIVSGPSLKLNQCGLPKKMALELFKPFIINKLINAGLSHNVRAANKLIEQETDEVWEFLEEVIQNRYVLLNRAPTLHRLGVQAFQPVLIEGQAIQLHPLVCTAFNADFDGDQMAVHLPLSRKAQDEARNIMASDKNFLKPATGEPIINPQKDIVWGCYWMTKIQSGVKGQGKTFNNFDEAMLAYEFDEIDLKAEIIIRGMVGHTCVGRIIVNQALPENIEFCNEVLDKKNLSRLVTQVLNKCQHKDIVKFLDDIKELGFCYSTKSGLSWSMDNLKTPPEKEKFIKDAEQKIEAIEEYYKQGLLTDDERYAQVISIWAEVKGRLADLVKESLDPNGSAYSMVDSKARGSWELINQMSGMKGLVVNPAGKIIELPIKSSLKEGFSVLEYFISTHGTRKGMADTAVRTAAAGYLTRRLIDVSQDVVIREEDCGAKKGIILLKEDCEAMGQTMSQRLLGRVALDGTIIDYEKAKAIEESGEDQIIVRSPITCETRRGICQKCYGYDLAKMQIINLGEAIGIVTAQAIGEPGTQLTLRTFHTGGVAGGEDITQGLPRVEELFEVRRPKGEAIMAEENGRITSITDKDGSKIINFKTKDKNLKSYEIPKKHALWIKQGDEVKKGQQLCEGSLDLQKLLKFSGLEAVCRYLVNQIQVIYAAEGASINEKHIEVVVRQMLSRVRITDPGGTNLLPNEIMNKDYVLEVNDGLRKNKKPAKIEHLLLGVTKVSLSTESWLSAASFQETARVLVNAATMSKEDNLRGLKENVIIGKLIPAGTGLMVRGRPDSNRRSSA
ncbi:MAG: DNA-directed RNA polymerase subunit beta' [bacterium]